MSDKPDNVERPLPQSVGCEKSVLSTILQDPKDFIPVAISEGLTPESFYTPAHSTLFEVILDTFNKGQEIELVSLVQLLLDKGKLERVGGPGALTELYTYAATSGYFKTHLAEVQKKARARQSIEVFRAGEQSIWDEPEESDASIRNTCKLLETISSEVKGGSGFTIELAGLSAGAIAAQDFVEGLLTEGGASVIYGPSNCGKSFWILDLAVCVATGADFRDELEVDQGAVVYVALEGSNGFHNRIEALKQAGKLDDSTPLFLCFAPVSLLEVGHAAKLAESVKQAAQQSSLPCRLVILDTLARAMAGGDENSGQDMTKAVASIDAIRAATGAHVAVVHHCGKDEARGARGHSSLRAAVDTEIEVSRPEGESISTVRVTKQRDMSTGEAMPFSLESVTLGTDRRGKPITSCLVHHEDSMMATTKAKAGRKPTCTAEDMLRFLPAASVKEWQERVKEETGLGQSQFYTHKSALEAKGKFRRETATQRIIAA